MTERIKSSRIVLADGLLDGYVYMRDGKIAAVTAEDLPCDRTVDWGDCYVSPGFVDLHVHGGAGYDFGSCTAKEADRIAAHHLAHGTTTMLATLAAAPLAEMAAAVERLRNCTAPNIVGVHMEGPYFSPAQCGAQNTAFITAPQSADYQPFLAANADVVKRWSYAPERDENGAFCKALCRYGVIPSAGHTDAVGADMQAAFANGCRLVTHLYSCTSTVTRQNGYRQLGVIEYAYLTDDITAEIIADGAHLPPDLIRLVVKIKGRERVMLTTDALAVSGSDEMAGEMNGVAYIVEDGVCKLPDRSAFAGSIATADRLVRTCVQDAALPLVDSVYMAATVPAAVLGLKKGLLAVGYDADLVVFDENIVVNAVYIKGKQI